MPIWFRRLFRRTKARRIERLENRIRILTGPCQKLTRLMQERPCPPTPEWEHEREKVCYEILLSTPTEGDGVPE